MLRLVRVVVVAVAWLSAVVLPRVASGPRYEAGPDVFTRERVATCGAALRSALEDAQLWDAAMSEATVAAFVEALSLGDDLLVPRGGRPPPKVVYAVACLRSSAGRVAWVESVVARHRSFVVLNATDKDDAAVAKAHYAALGLTTHFKLSPGQTGLWISELRFLALLLLSKADYGVLLEDDAEVDDDFEAKVDEYTNRMTPEMKYSSYRLGRYTVGMLYPKEAAARLLGLACRPEPIALPIDHYTVSKVHPWGCRHTYNGVPLELLVRQGPASHVSNLGSSPAHATAFDGAFHAHARPRDAPTGGFCHAEYPGRVEDDKVLVSVPETVIAQREIAAAAAALAPPGGEEEALPRVVPSSTRSSARGAAPPPPPQAPSSNSSSVPPPFEDVFEGLTSRIIIVPEHKLLFCYIEKNSCTAFNKLFMSVRARYDESQSIVGKPPNGAWLWKKNEPAAHRWSARDLEEAIVDPAWHKAVFYREPLERFVSALSSKCALDGRKHDGDGPAHCRDQFGVNTIAFADAVRTLRKRDNDTAPLQNVDNIHFRRQSQFCGGLTHTLRYYQTVERLDRATSRAKVIKLLADVGVDSTTVPAFDALFPADTAPPKKRPDQHDTNSDVETTHRYFRDRAAKEGLDPDEAIRAVVDHYIDDYLLFGIQTPEWALDAIARRPPARRPPF